MRVIHVLVVAIWILTVGGCVSSLGIVYVIEGRGASFPAPLYWKLTQEYVRITGINIEYFPSNSYMGLKSLQDSSVDFGATDSPLAPDEVEKLRVMQFPFTCGGIVVVVNVQGIASGDMILDSLTLAAIFSGRITAWDDPRIAVLNPGVQFPHTQIAVVVRSDGSGTTLNFTKYLSKGSGYWTDELGVADWIEWPVGAGAKGNGGVADAVRRIPNAIGYTSYTHAVQGNLTLVKLVNDSGVVVAPTPESFQAAAPYACWEGRGGVGDAVPTVVSRDGYPIMAVSFVVMQRKPATPNHAVEALAFFRWAFTEGAPTVRNLGYVPLPSALAAAVANQWHAEFRVDFGGE